MNKKLLHLLLYIGFVGASLTALLGSCQLGKPYARPQLGLPQQIDSMAGTDTSSIGDYAWERIYADTTLQALIRQTLEQNKDMHIAAAKVKEMAAMKRIDQANLFPEATAQAAGKKEGTNYGGDNYKNSVEFDLKGSISWELDLWGKLRWARDKSLAEFIGSVENQRALRMTLVASVAQAYFELLALDNELSIVRKTVDARKESLHLAKLRYEGGLTSEVPYRQAQVELSRTTALMPDLERQIAIKESDIAFLTGGYPHHIHRESLPADVVLPESLPVGLPSSLLERRPDVRSAEQDLIAAHADVGVAFTGLFPTLSLTTTLGAESDALSNLLKSPYHLISGGLVSPLFAMGKNRANLKAKKAAREQAVYAYEKAVQNAFKEAYDAIINFNKTKEIYDAQLRLEQASKSTLELAQLQYINGAIGYMDLLDAQRGYLDAQIDLSNAVRDKQLSIVNLYKALGGGWKE